MSTEVILDAVKEVAENFTETTNGLIERVEKLEIENDRPQKGPRPRFGDTPKYRVMDDNGVKSFVLPRDTKLTDVPELQPKSTPEISLDRWARALIFGSNCGDRQAVEYLAEQKSVTTGSTGVLIPAEFVPGWIDMARAQSVLVRAGAQTVPMNAQTVTYAHQTADPTFSWRSTEGASLSASDPTFASRTLTAKTVAVRTQVSLEATQDIPDFGAQITSAYTRAFGAAIDQAGIVGAGGASPLLIPGLYNTSGVGSVPGVGVPTNWDEVIDGAATFLNANNDLSELTGMIMHPNIWRTYAKLKTGISSDNTSLELPPAISQVPKFVTTNADSVTSPENYHVVLGNFNDLVVGVRMNPTIRILDDTTSFAGNLLIEIVGVARIDFLVTRPASFVVLEGLGAS